ncbi:rRNA biogenesis protein RRP5, putative [Plasmodium berghei]|uniref:rRNA biogenesis protein RRP5, putative n=2 Tax=Plasmodium berghei TaxID=5821 RepID=A0A509ANG9_PLABA|nr:rRNA biogenesis protein RRP5, putative [Plasmodium berghei ANKA]SCN26487.1 rRNA biogenesis protein RRP5, putative [Plasmodium berghei]VUC56373.1 rRNA biogenesis protein RRP5, putative [Plasmodium berghei ANKA]|eukprot:XP_034422175.1 rRNA biogenesis protein RRP5, putative [Plasmodium berghei ANKA]
MTIAEDDQLDTTHEEIKPQNEGNDQICEKKNDINNVKIKNNKKIEGKAIIKDHNKRGNLSLYAEIQNKKKKKKKKKKKSDKEDEIGNEKEEKINIKKHKETQEYNSSSNEEDEKFDSCDEGDNNNILLNNKIINNKNGQNEEQVKPYDYEKLLVSEKNKSTIWISYIVYYLEKGNIQEARNIAERALKTIDIHLIEEKLNIYLCYINMECAYGDNLNEIFKRALLVNNEKSIYLHTMNILKMNKKLNELKELCEEGIKKFKYSKKIWTRYLELLHNTLNDEEYAHNILLKSLHALPKRKHLNIIINAARFEYKYSNIERGKNYFEKLIQEYPKRSDIWFTYLDIHINSLTKAKKNENDDENQKKKIKKLTLNELQFIRNIFERFLSIKFKTRVMKMIFTKWLLFEKNHGSVNTQKMVQKKAYDYVESLNALV